MKVSAVEKIVPLGWFPFIPVKVGAGQPVFQEGDFSVKLHIGPSASILDNNLVYTHPGGNK
jgi:hypothetical protein